MKKTNATLSIGILGSILMFGFVIGSNTPSIFANPGSGMNKTMMMMDNATKTTSAMGNDMMMMNKSNMQMIHQNITNMIDMALKKVNETKSALASGDQNKTSSLLDELNIQLSNLSAKVNWVGQMMMGQHNQTKSMMMGGNSTHMMK